MAGILAWFGPAIASAQPPAPFADHARLWQAYASRFISGDGRVVDPQEGDRTTSEGQSYALFFALVNNDRARFDKLVTWTMGNLAAGDLGAHLPAWSWGKGKDGNWGVLDSNSASDSDIWIAYDLIEAGRLWKDPHYSALGRRLASLAGRREVANLPGFGPALMPGAAGFKFPRAWVLNPSYTPLFILDRLAAVDPAGPWADVAVMVPAMIERSAKSGFAMDWISYTPGEGFTPCLVNGKKTSAAVGSYDAIRVYLWAGMLSDSSPAKSKLLKALSGMNAFLAQHGAPPEKINNDGTPQAQDGPVGFSAALLPYLKSLDNDPAVAQQLVRLKAQLDEKSNLYGAGYGSGPTYYDQNLVLFGSGWLDKRFQFGNSGELLVRWSR
jgi:endo-1,4-beta-D-glucanase Y